ncbi:MAG: hypothetical protein LBG19_00285 [Prevotellaceae bacterium]|jgi:hypothetical protein|nr:hypothetical protein [Prevotellaceae bacterium]
MERKVRVMLLAHSNAGESLFTKWKKRFLDIFDNTKVEFVTTDADILVFLTDNSAVNAIEEVQKNTFKHYILMAVSSDRAYTSAVEVKAWMNQNNISSYAIIEHDAPETSLMVADMYDAKNAFIRMSDRRIYVPNNRMNELVASDISPFVLEAKFGIRLGYKSDEAANNIDISTCAGDVCSAIGMLFVNELCGQLPQVMEIANMTSSSIKFEACDASTVLADCCGVKATHLDLLNSDEATLFRFNNTFTKAFMKAVKVKKHTESSSAVELGLDPAGMEYFLKNPLGSHHLILSGNHARKLALACIMKNIAIVN